jgi:very-short-patch-repair endonuclease
LSATASPFLTVSSSPARTGEYRLDFAYPELKLAIEVDGYVWHFSPEHTGRDNNRRNKLTLQGWQILVYTWREVADEPERVAREIAAAYAGAIA